VALAWSIGWKLIALYAGVLLFGPAMGGSIGQGIADLRDWQVGLVTGQEVALPWGSGGQKVVVTDAAFVALSAGSVRLGDPDGEGPRPSKAAIEVPGFSMMRHEVTVDAYRTACPREWWQLSCPDWEPERWQKGNHPAVRVTWQQAADWCAAQGWRLPTEVEWEYAARGEAGRRHPWGDEFAERSMNYCDKGCPGKVFDLTGEDDGQPRTAPAGTFPRGATEEGILDLAGNASEWTLDCWTDHHEARTSWHASKTPSCRRRVARGGSWKDTVDQQTGWQRSEADPKLPSERIGFRCVQGEEPAAAE
jgi:formylglycine-generating enzyme required for sulfatase activity